MIQTGGLQHGNLLPLGVDHFDLFAQVSGYKIFRGMGVKCDQHTLSVHLVASSLIRLMIT
jgi:hypothetical protein